MKHKTWLFFSLIFAISVGFLAYQAGANTPKLDPHYQNYNDLASTNQNNHFTAIMRDNLLKRLSTRIKNHETRISALASDTTATKLTSEQMNFDKYLSNHHHNRFNSGMRNNTLKMLTYAITNHESRLIQAELKCAKPAPQKEFQCIGSYIISPSHQICTIKPNIGKPHLSCRCGSDRKTLYHSYSMDACTNSRSMIEGDGISRRGGNLHSEREDNNRYCDVGFRQGLADGFHNPKFVSALRTSDPNNPNYKRDRSCTLDDCSSKKCEKKTIPEKRGNCSEFTTAFACGQKSGCSRVEKK